MPPSFLVSSISTTTVLSLVIPTYNEAHNIKGLLQEIVQVLDPLLKGSYELIVVDDDSPDGTWQIVETFQREYPQIRVIRRQNERGLSTAILRGWQVATGSVLGVIDGDCQHPPDILSQLLEKIAHGADLALASRHIKGGGVSHWSFMRRFVSRGAQVIGLVILPGVVGRVSDPLSGYFLVQRSAIADRILDPVGYKILIEVIARGSIARIEEVGYVFQERQNGDSKITLYTCWQYLVHLLKLRLTLGPLGKFIQFVLVGFTGLFIDTSLLYVLHDPSMVNAPLLLSNLVSSELAIINNFCWNDLWTFRSLSITQPGWKNRLKRLLKFNLVCLVGVALNTGLLLVFEKGLRIHYLIAKFMAVVLVTFWNFFINLKLSWRVTDAK
jgi:dolichol-phosphate mannosyltransferase